MSSRNNSTDRKTTDYIQSQRTTIKKICLLPLAFAIVAFLPLTADAHEIGDLKNMIIKMEQRHQQEMAELRKQIEQLSNVETEEAKVIEKLKPSDHEIFYDRLQRLEREVKTVPAENGTMGFTSTKGWHVDLYGELEFEFVSAQEGVEGGGGDPDAHFQIDQLYLYPTAKYKDLAFFSADIAIKPSDTQTGLLEEAWARFFILPFGTYVEAGINDLFLSNIQRKTETEILIENAFYRDDALGVRVGGKPLDWLYWEASATNEFQLGTRVASEDSSFPLIADRRNNANASERLNLGLAVGFNPDLGRYGKFDILPFYYDSLLSENDIRFLQAIPGYGATNPANNKQRYGVNLRYDYSDFTIMGQLLVAEDGALNRTGWFVQPSYVLYKNPNWQWLNSYELVYRYNDLQVDLPHIFANSLTWDRQQHVFALLVGLIDKTSLKFEYIINDEKTGGAEVKNNEFMIQAEVIW